jgi:hypothetical protein
VARFAQKYPALLDALLKSVLELVCKYHKTGEAGRRARGQLLPVAAALVIRSTVGFAATVLRAAL